MHGRFACLVGLFIGSACAQTQSTPADSAAHAARDRSSDASDAGPDARLVSPPDARHGAATGGPGRASDEDDEATGFGSCAADSDCVAVDRVGCCHNGWKASVSSSQIETYRRSFTCPDPHPICAMYIVRDLRLPRCDPATKVCVLTHP